VGGTIPSGSQIGAGSSEGTVFGNCNGGPLGVSFDYRNESLATVDVWRDDGGADAAYVSLASDGTMVGPNNPTVSDTSGERVIFEIGGGGTAAQTIVATGVHRTTGSCTFVFHRLS